MYRCILALTTLSLWITTVASIVALFAPFWIISVENGTEETEGLYMSCENPFEENAQCEFYSYNRGEKWLTACQGLWTAGTGLMFIVAICSFCLCCETCRNYTCTILVAIGIFLAAGALIATIILYGVKKSELFDVNLFDRDLPHFDWGYYVAIIAAALSILTSVLASITICCIRRKK